MPSKMIQGDCVPMPRAVICFTQAHPGKTYVPRVKGKMILSIGLKEPGLDRKGKQYCTPQARRANTRTEACQTVRAT